MPRRTRPAVLTLITVACLVPGQAAFAAQAAAARHDGPTARTTWPGSAPAVRAGTGGASGPASRLLVAARPEPRLPAGQQFACPAPSRPGQMQCRGIIETAGSPPAGASGTAGTIRVLGYSPASLRSAYRLATAAARHGTGETIAIVDAFSDPRAASDLAAYRRHYGLPSCTLASRCLRIVNEYGRTSPLPGANRGWAGEESLDLDMVSAICPRCRILLIEARTNQIVNLGIAEDTAVAKGARFISNSWSGGEFVGEQQFDRYFNHPGVVIAFAAGDAGYGTAYPTDIQYVTAVGGTTLRPARNGRGWSETVWPGTGSGCSALAAKASWQNADDTAPNGCLNRTGNDVAADANLSTGVSIYDSYLTGGPWLIAGGTSVATPIITATYALAGTPAAGTYPAAYPYQRASQFFDVTSGGNGTCEPNRQYLCRGKPGYDGPTGLGTPDGTAGFAAGGAQHVTLVDPGVQDVPAGSGFSLRITGLDANLRATGLSYSATGLPAGLSIAPVAHSLDAVISGTLPSTPGTSTVTVLARDASTGHSAATTFELVSVASLASQASPSFGEVQLDIEGPLAGHCLTDAAMTAGSPVTFSACTQQPDQSWGYLPAGNPGGPGVLQLNGFCLSATSAGVQAKLATCAGAAGEHWQDLGSGLLMNRQSRLCLAAAGTGTAVVTEPCTGASRQIWTRAAGSVVSGVGSVCMDDGLSVLQVLTCDNSPQDQLWIMAPAGLIQSSWIGWCLDMMTSTLDGVVPGFNYGCFGAVDLPTGSETWIPGPGGELINAFSGKCLADPGNGGTSTKLVQEDCYGAAGEIWAYN